MICTEWAMLFLLDWTMLERKILTCMKNEGQTWVAANSGGISTFSDRGSGKNWWKLEQGVEIPSQLRVINDYGNHWLWEPSYSMMLEDDQEALRSIGTQFYKVS